MDLLLSKIFFIVYFFFRFVFNNNKNKKREECVASLSCTSGATRRKANVQGPTRSSFARAKSNINPFIYFSFLYVASLIPSKHTRIAAGIIQLVVIDYTLSVLCCTTIIIKTWRIQRSTPTQFNYFLFPI